MAKNVAISVHTPGPWVIKIGAAYRHIESKDGLPVCFVSSNNWDEKANARLISSAPYLLEALIECLNCEFPVTDKSAIAKAEAAISYAKNGC